MAVSANGGAQWTLEPLALEGAANDENDKSSPQSRVNCKPHRANIRLAACPASVQTEAQENLHDPGELTVRAIKC